MSSPSAASSVEIGELQRRMAQIRREMHEDVQGAVRGAQSLTDWRSIVGSHPWSALSVAFGVGYLLVPRRSAEPPAFKGTIAPAQTNQAVAVREPQSEKNLFRPLGAAYGLLAPVLVRAAQNYALSYVEQWLAQHPFHLNESERGRRVEPRQDESGGPEARTVRFPDRR